MVTNNGLDSAILKAKFGTDIRKSELHHIQDLNFNDLILMMQRIFQIKVNTNIQLKYRDAEGDWITLANDDDVMFALRHEPSLYIEVSTNSEQGSRPTSPLHSESVLTTRVSGISVNDEVTSLLLKNEAISTPIVKQQQSVPPTITELSQQQQPSTPTAHQLSFDSVEKPPSVQSFTNAQNQQNLVTPPSIDNLQQHQQQVNQIPPYGAVEQQPPPSISSSVGQAQLPPYGYEQNTHVPPLTAPPQQPNHQHLPETQQFQPYSAPQQPPVLPPTSVGQPQPLPPYGHVLPPQQHHQQQQQHATPLSATPVHHDQQQAIPPYGSNQHQQQQPPLPTSVGQHQVVPPYGNAPHQAGLPPTSIGQPPQHVPSFASPQQPQPFGYAPPPPPVSSVIGGAGGPAGNPFSRAPNAAFARPPSNFGNYFQ